MCCQPPHLPLPPTALLLLRAVSQNKELKEQLAELQEAFVTQSHRSMELATVLETEQIRNQKLQQEKEKAEEHVDEIRLKLQERTVESAEGTTSLYHSRIEVSTHITDPPYCVDLLVTLLGRS